MNFCARFVLMQNAHSTLSTALHSPFVCPTIGSRSNACAVLFAWINCVFSRFSNFRCDTNDIMWHWLRLRFSIECFFGFVRPTPKWLWLFSIRKSHELVIRWRNWARMNWIAFFYCFKSMVCRMVVKVRDQIEHTWELVEVTMVTTTRK